MPMPFKSEQQGRLFSAVLRELGRIGYARELIVPSYHIRDWFDDDEFVIEYLLACWEVEE